MSGDSISIGDVTYQGKVVQALIQDHEYAEQISDVMKPEYFSQEYLKEIVSLLFVYKRKYNAFPSPEVINDMLAKEGVTDLVLSQARVFLTRAAEQPLNGDAGYIRDTSLDFCRKMSIKEGMEKALDALADNNFDSIVKIIMDSASRGASRDVGHEYMGGFRYRSEKSVRCPIPTPWPVLNEIFGGGWERKTLTTFIAPTGAGKTHFLCNVSAGMIANGYNGVYVTLEIADFKIGLRHDAYFSGVKINDVPAEMDRVEAEVREQAKGRLFIKEYPTKMASVQTLRSYLKRLQSIHGFTPDFLVLDYADLLRPSKSYGEKRHELEGIYEELRGLGQEMNMVVVTADQTNRVGLNLEIVTLDAIAESYAKATVCDLIMTVSRKLEDKVTKSGRLFVAKSRLGPDGMVYPFMMDPATVRVRVLNQFETAAEAFKQSEEEAKEHLKTRFDHLMKKTEGN